MKGSASFTTLLAVILLLWTTGPVLAQNQVSKIQYKAPWEKSTTADHKKFKALSQDFKTGPEVTKACLTCHTEAARQVQENIHWTWQCNKGMEKGLGKRKAINNF